MVCFFLALSFLDLCFFLFFGEDDFRFCFVHFWFAHVVNAMDMNILYVFISLGYDYYDLIGSCVKNIHFFRGLQPNAKIKIRNTNVIKPTVGLKSGFFSHFATCMWFIGRCKVCASHVCIHISLPCLVWFYPNFNDESIDFLFFFEIFFLQIWEQTMNSDFLSIHRLQMDAVSLALAFIQFSLTRKKKPRQNKQIK